MSAPIPSSVLSLFAGGVRLSVRAKPDARKPRAPRLVDTGDGKLALEISVAAAPEDGKANKALLSFLAGKLGLKKNQLSIKTGATGRLKIVEIDGDPAALQQTIASWLASLTP